MFLDRLSLWLGRALAWVFLIIAGMMTYEVVVRYAFNAPTFWAHEIAGVLAAVAFIFGGAYCMADQSHMRITVLIDRLGPRVRAVSHYLSIVVGIVYLAGLSFAAWRMTDTALFRFTSDGLWNPERSGSSWNTPAPSFIKLALFLGAALFLAVLLRDLFARYRAGKPDRHSDAP
ncbi:MAG: TRAP transporter small permease [Alphaproteobacteria bacterium]|nr:TRAP transporter small permease [Alphaproteobacteria bacterium]